MKDGIADASLSQQAGKVAPARAVHLIDDHVFIRKESANTVKVDGYAAVAFAIFFNPVDVIIEGVKTAHLATQAAFFNIRHAALRIQ